jgi:hypothetical protein
VRRYVFAAEGAPSEAGDGGAMGWNWEAYRRVVSWAICDRSGARVLVLVLLKGMFRDGNDGPDKDLIAHRRHIARGRIISLLASTVKGARE